MKRQWIDRVVAFHQRHRREFTFAILGLCALLLALSLLANG